jgi:GDPmannose 4,6-dehydratase
MKRRAMICGVTGQDGSYLAKLLLSKGYEVWGSSRDAELNPFHNLHYLGIFDAVQRISLNPIDVGSILGILRRIRPDEVFSLSGQSSVGLSFEQPVETIQSIAVTTLNLLEGIRLSDSNIRFYNAGSTECFGDTGNGIANESTQFNPRSPYAVAKASAYWTVANYRDAYGMFACTGILSNHDSPLRPLRFVTRKIIHAVASLALGKDIKLTLGNIDVERDWGWAPEYVEAISLMLEQPEPKDYVIATGHSHTLTQFVETAFNLIGKDWREYVTADKRLVRPTDIARNKVDPSKAATELRWQAQRGMADVISLMLEAEISTLKRDAGA